MLQIQLISLPVLIIGGTWLVTVLTFIVWIGGIVYDELANDGDQGRVYTITGKTFGWSLIASIVISILIALIALFNYLFTYVPQ